MVAPSVLYFDSDQSFAAATVQELSREGFDVSYVNDPAQLGDQSCDVVLLDAGDADPSAMCRRLRARTGVPIVMTSVHDELGDRVLGLESGADDFLGKPFSMRELAARLRAHARRQRGEMRPRVERIEVGTLVLDESALSIMIGERRISVTAYEFSVMMALARRAGQVVSRNALLELTDAQQRLRSIDVAIFRIRTKLEPDQRCLQTVRGAGYMLVAP
jgi:two-component system response regulator RstA